MEGMQLSQSDYRFMLVVWEHEPLTSGRLVILCANNLGWKKPTTYTMLRRLCEKGLLKNEGTVVTSLVPKEKVQAFESEHFMKRAFSGSLPMFLSSFLDGKSITEREAEELKKVIDAHKRI
jgi:predicted transcriptional regulator